VTEYCTVTAEKASKQICDKSSTNSPQRVMYIVSSSAAMYLKTKVLLVCSKTHELTIHTSITRGSGGGGEVAPGSKVQGSKIERK
jgi:hypothetical protein